MVIGLVHRQRLLLTYSRHCRSGLVSLFVIGTANSEPVMLELGVMISTPMYKKPGGFYAICLSHPDIDDDRGFRDAQPLELDIATSKE